MVKRSAKKAGAKTNNKRAKPTSQVKVQNKNQNRIQVRKSKNKKNRLNNSSDLKKNAPKVNFCLKLFFKLDAGL